MTAEQASAADLRWRWEQPVPLRWLLVDESTMMMDEPDAAVAVCSGIDGLFAGGPDEPGSGAPSLAAGPARLVGCLPLEPLRGALDALARGAGAPGGALWRRRVSAAVFSVTEDGTAARLMPSAGLHASSVTGFSPSPLGEGLLDVTFDAAVAGPLPAGAAPIWELWRRGRPAEPGQWASYAPGLRHYWSGAALAHRQQGLPDKPPGTTYHLDGRHVTDEASFYCALGEAVAGPGGYFGWNPAALHDCLRGGWGAAPPFQLIWHDAPVARAHLGADWDQLLTWLAEDSVTVELA
jgi:Barstar (barnase inhibitor)